MKRSDKVPKRSRCMLWPTPLGVMKLKPSGKVAWLRWDQLTRREADAIAAKLRGPAG